MRTFIRQLRPALVMLLISTVVVGLMYPLLVTGFAQVAFPGRSDGSLVKVNGTAVGSRLIGQSFTSPQYFQSRPSAAGKGYDASASSGSNLGPKSADLEKLVSERAIAYRETNGLPLGFAVPVDAVTASGSGLDPHISVANARIQANRVADVRNVDVAVVVSMISAHIDSRPLGVLGDEGVNVLALNVALDALPES